MRASLLSFEGGPHCTFSFRKFLWERQGEIVSPTLRDAKDGAPWPPDEKLISAGFRNSRVGGKE